jgi:galactokinase
MKDCVELLLATFGAGEEPRTLQMPGRVNLIGEHIDYHGLAVLPMGVPRRIEVAYRARADRRVCAVSPAPYGMRTFEWTAKLESGPAGDWGNYVKAAAQAVGDKWPLEHGIDAAVMSDLPAAAGLSSSSALLAAFALALLRANGVEPSFEELMEVLPEGEYFVGTRGGGMDHAAVLSARPGYATLVRFAPVSVEMIAVPAGWSFLVAHSMTHAEKSGAVRAEYNSRRVAGTRALAKLGYGSYLEVPEGCGTDGLDEEERRCFLHVAGEGRRVLAAAEAMRRGDAAEFGRLLYESHASARDLLRISTPALDELVEAARGAGAMGARLTGAGFGGCAVVFCLSRDLEEVTSGLLGSFYAERPRFDVFSHLIEV